MIHARNSKLNVHCTRTTDSASTETLKRAACPSSWNSVVAGRVDHHITGILALCVAGGLSYGLGNLWGDGTGRLKFNNNGRNVRGVDTAAVRVRWRCWRHCIYTQEKRMIAKTRTNKLVDIKFEYRQIVGQTNTTRSGCIDKLDDHKYHMPQPRFEWKNWWLHTSMIHTRMPWMITDLNRWWINLSMDE